MLIDFKLTQVTVEVQLTVLLAVCLESVWRILQVVSVANRWQYGQSRGYTVD